MTLRRHAVFDRLSELTPRRESGMDRLSTKCPEHRLFCSGWVSCEPCFVFFTAVSRCLCHAHVKKHLSSHRCTQQFTQLGQEVASSSEISSGCFLQLFPLGRQLPAQESELLRQNLVFMGKAEENAVPDDRPRKSLASLPVVRREGGCALAAIAGQTWAVLGMPTGGAICTMCPHRGPQAFIWQFCRYDPTALAVPENRHHIVC